MSIKARFFGKPWQHKDPVVRAQAVAESDDPDLVQELGRIAEHDESARVRLAALRRINTEPFWLDARLRESDTAIAEAADTFLVKAIMQRANDELLTERLEWFRRIDDAEFVRRVAAGAPERNLRAEALARLDSPGFLGDRVVEEKDEELALSLIERIDQPSTLERIAAVLRRRSKRRAQAVEQRLRELQAARGEYDAAAESASRLVERAERLARGQFEGDRRQELDELETLWMQVDAPAEAPERRFRGALEIVKRSLEARARPPLGHEEGATAATEEPPPNTSLLGVVDRLEAIERIDRIAPKEAARLLGEFDRAWQSVEHPQTAEQALRERALPILRELQVRRQQATTPDSDKPRPRPPADTTDWSAELDALAGLLDAGDTARAQASLRELRSRHDRLKPRQRPRQVSGRLGRLAGRLREMRNWEHWSNNKHRDELIERVEQLAGSGQHPDAISATLKEARKQWQQLENLEVLPGDKRQHAAPTGQWRRFQAACKSAFEQAQPFFEKRHEVQNENLEQLEAFLERGRALADDQETDLDTLRKFSKSARLAITRLDDIPPKTRGRSAARLRELLDAFSKQIDAAFETIENAKRRLIREAQALEHETDLKTAIDQAKSLQARWQQAGTGRRRVEQQLWMEFRAPIDPLFEKLQGERDQRREEQEAEVTALHALLEQAEQVAESDEAELDQAEGRMKAIRSQWNAAGRRPASLTERFDKAQQTLARRLADRRLQARRDILARLDELAAGVQSAWQARQAGKTPTVELPEPGPDDDEATRALHEAARTIADSSIDGDALARQVADNGEQARQIVIEMEFLAGVESPAEDRQARMNFQVERLAQRMSERGETPGLGDELAGLRQRWYASFPHPLDGHEGMAKRFNKCQNVLESMSGTE